MATATLTRTTAAAACPDWCDNVCAEWSDSDGSRYHGSGFTSITVDSHDRPNVELSVSTTRLDYPDEPGNPEVHLLAGGHLGEDFVMPAAKARELAAMLLNAADTADPPPLIRRTRTRTRRRTVHQ